jgi:micrococcal nuclease
MRTLVLVFAIAAAIGAATASGRGEGRFTLAGTVIHVVDGDTLSARLANGRVERIRLIGIDTPETGDCGAAAATAEARRQAEDRRVVLRGDPTQDTRDRYGRLLAYAWIDGRRDLGYQLLARGLARVYVYERPFQRLGAYRAAERVGSPRRPRCAAPAPPPASGGACDPAYPGVCIPPPPPDLDCADVPYTAFRVVGADPHRFDGDHDGVGCEG